MIKYVVVIPLIYILYFMYFKIKYRFWSRQPVFHMHNLFYWCFPVGIIQKKPPKLKKFFDTKITSKDISLLSTNDKKSVHQLIHSFYLNTHDTNYLPTLKGIFSYFENHNDKSFISMLFQQKQRVDYTNKQTFLNKQLIAVITSRPLEVHLREGNFSGNVHYVDYLCIDPEQRGKRIAPRLIFTHQARVRNNSKNQVFLFKRETKLSTIVPLTTYYTYGFDTKYWKYSSKPISEFNHFKLNSQNIDNFYHIIEKIKKQFKCTVYPALSNLNTLIKNDLITIYMLLKKNNPIACYVFRKPFTTYKRDGKIGNSMDLICSFFDRSINPEIFVYYFYFSTFIIQKNKQFKYFIIENISDNNIIIQNIFKKFFPIIKSPTAYFFYNFAYRPILPYDLFILN